MSKFTDVIVVVHGIGDQLRYATARSVANRMATSMILRDGGAGYPVSPQPLGYFHSDVKSLVKSRLVDDDGRLSGMSLASIGVAEAFWADIPEEVVNEGHTMEETKAWAGTVVARAKALYEDANRPTYIQPDFGMAAEVLGEMIDTIHVLENFCAIAEKLGIFTFDLRKVLEDYLGDVQVVTEFNYHRTNIIGRFHKAMEDVYESVRAESPEVKLHIVAHSEGTVVSFLGLLHAMSRQEFTPATENEEATQKVRAHHPEWLKHVAGYMTLGSPIDKHLLLWPRLWEKLQPDLANALFKDRKIKWRNYYDYGDPVGFKLDTAREWLAGKSAAFEFKEEHDHGFSRYLLPGKAHNDYWNDPEVFEHFIADVIKKPAKPVAPPANKPSVAILSPTLPYLLSFFVLMAGCYLLYKQIGLYARPEPGPMEATEIARRIGVTRSTSVNGWDLLRNVFGVASLLAGTTLIARLPRMMAHRSWIFFALLGFLAGAFTYWQVVPDNSRQDIGSFCHLLGGVDPTLGVLVLAFGVGLVGFVTTLGRGSDRRERWFWRGMRPMISCGAFGILVIIAGRVFPEKVGGGTRLTREETAFVAKYVDQTVANVPEDRRETARHRLQEQFDEDFAEARFTREEIEQFFGRNEPTDPINEKEAATHLARLDTTSPLLGNRPAVWPVVLAATAFLYLWWLATLLFDLAFIWQRYIRQAATNRRLQEWYHIKQTSTPPFPVARTGE